MFIIQFFGRDIRAISSFGYKLLFWFFRTGKMMSSWVVVCFCVERFVAVLAKTKKQHNSVIQNLSGFSLINCFRDTDAVVKDIG
jgi:uncharacterized membrane protein